MSAYGTKIRGRMKGYFDFLIYVLLGLILNLKNKEYKIWCFFTKNEKMSPVSIGIVRKVSILLFFKA